nr:hypothetical protein Iba_chr15eCG4710 [Ipomoea batatas]
MLVFHHFLLETNSGELLCILLNLRSELCNLRLKPDRRIRINEFKPSVFAFISSANFTAPSKNSATLTKSSSTNPLDVRAGVPGLSGTMADTSPGTVFLLAAMCTNSKTFSTREPSIPCKEKSQCTHKLRNEINIHLSPIQRNLDVIIF